MSGSGTHPARKGGAASASSLAPRETGSPEDAFLTAALVEKARDATDHLTRPFFEGLKLVPDPTWSPRTQLDFYREQAALAERVLDRVEGTPVARTKQMRPGFGADGGELSLDDLPPSVVVEMMARLLGAAGESPSDLALRARELEADRRRALLQAAEDQGFDSSRMGEMTNDEIAALLA